MWLLQEPEMVSATRCPMLVWSPGREAARRSMMTVRSAATVANRVSLSPKKWRRAHRRRVTAAPLSKVAWQLVPQLNPIGLELTWPERRTDGWMR